MASYASRKRSANVIGRPIKPGEVRNPEGRNQYTYRRDLETKADELLKGELSPEQIAKLPGWVQDAIEPGMTRGEAIAAMTIAGALRGERPYYQEALKRVWPAEVAVSASIETPTPWWDNLPDMTHLSEEEIKEIRRLAHEDLMRGPRPTPGGGDDE